MMAHRRWATARPASGIATTAAPAVETAEVEAGVGGADDAADGGATTGTVAPKAHAGRTNGRQSTAPRSAAAASRANARRAVVAAASNAAKAVAAASNARVLEAEGSN